MFFLMGHILKWIQCHGCRCNDIFTWVVFAEVLTVSQTFHAWNLDTAKHLNVSEITTIKVKSPCSDNVSTQ